MGRGNGGEGMEEVVIGRFRGRGRRRGEGMVLIGRCVISVCG